MSNYVSISVFTGELASAAVPVGFATSGAGALFIEQIQGALVMSGVTILSRIILASGGLNKYNTIYYSALDVPTLVTAFGATLYKTFSVYRNPNSTAAVNVAMPVTGEIGLVIQTAPTGVNAITIATVPILSQFVLLHQGLTQGKRIYYSGLTVAANVTTMG